MNHDGKSARPKPADIEPPAPRLPGARAPSDEQSPSLPFPVVGIGASAGGLEAVQELLKTVRTDSGMAYVLIQHLPPDRDSMMADILSHHSAIAVSQVNDGDVVQKDHLYVIRPGSTLTIKDGKLHLGERLASPGNNRPIDDFFRSLAEQQRERAIAIIMSGMGSNGSAGAQAVKAVGGLCIAQDPESAKYPSMPKHLIDSGYADYILRPGDMAEVLRAYAGHPYARSGEADAEKLLAVEQQHLREILTVLRTRSRQDFTGYKKPTVLRRIQRRMGLTRITRLDDYIKLLRQSPSEVTALADDLLIHVTGFFRDPEHWESLRQNVIVPLVTLRESEASVRCWAAACSSGQEAYTLAMLLVEECDRQSKRLDIKVFATDMSERMLQSARIGLYPGGIETEMSPERLDRFFQKEDAVYRVRQELREHVVFAQQNILQDPPFSRLDIITCRNLLIYLEPDVQQRVLSLLHFGLREGGALFLGTSETTAVDAEELFVPIDKKARIFRRVGPTRHGAVEFPMPHAFAVVRGDKPQTENQPPGARLSLSQLVTRALLESHAPAAVAVDRENRILFYHGNTEPFLASPRGEPTRDLVLLVREGVRSAVRTALRRSASENALAVAADGWIDLARGGRVRVVVKASPLDSRTPSDYFIVSFQEVDEAPANPDAKAADDNASDPRAANEELRRVRDELQSTIRELQTSNEELKASHEELTSTNEELQSTNEELETSREEMQSLNEELSTVNSQLHAKMEEHQAAHNDLSSLLTSTDIAVLFLDPQFRVRRFTPPVRALYDLIPSDIGRPLRDFSQKFTDPDLMADARLSLDRLSTSEREICGEGNQWFLRRVTPYRTTDDRIVGVVITFVNITQRRRADDALRDSESRVRLASEAAHLGFWEWDIQSGRFQRDAMANAILRLPDDRSGGNHEQFVQSLHPDDRGRILAAQQKAIESKTDFADEFRVVGADGAAHWVGGYGRLISDAAGQATHMIGGVIDISSRKAIEVERVDLLRREQIARAEAEAASHMKDEFLATLSHELRTPLSTILLWAKMLQRTQPPDSEQLQEGLTAIQHGAEAQRELIEDLLDVSRITSGKLRMQMKDIDLAQIVREAIEAILPTADAKGVGISADYGSDIGVVHADPHRLRQIVWNLASNAVKFTPAGGRVDVGLWRHEAEVQIRVSDTGRGIAPEFLPHVFDRFRQAEAMSTRGQGGLGLGLAIVKQLVELHGGVIEAKSAGIDQGATFNVLLPLPPLKDDAAASGASDLPPLSSPTTLRDAKILLLEDDQDTRNALTVLLRGTGARVIAVSTAAAALESIQNDRPDLIVSDIGLVGEDGYTFMRRVRAGEAAQGRVACPAVALTAFVRDQDRQLTHEAGFQKHLAKPVDPEKLLATLTDLLNARPS